MSHSPSSLPRERFKAILVRALVVSIEMLASQSGTEILAIRWMSSHEAVWALVGFSSSYMHWNPLKSSFMSLCAFKKYRPNVPNRKIRKIDCSSFANEFFYFCLITRIIWIKVYVSGGSFRTGDSNLFCKVT